MLALGLLLDLNNALAALVGLLASLLGGLL